MMKVLKTARMFVDVQTHDACRANTARAPDINTWRDTMDMLWDVVTNVTVPAHAIGHPPERHAL